MSDWLRKAMKLLGALLAISGITITVTVNIDHEPPPPVPVSELGWAGPEGVEAAQELVTGMPAFRIVGDAGDNNTRNVRLWDYAIKANGGEHLPNIAQQIGDCVSWGAANAVNYVQAVQIARDMQLSELQRAFPPYIYGTSRVQIGKNRLGRPDGSVGAWAAEAVHQFGVLSVDAEGCPEYSGALARSWGKTGPPDDLIDIAREYPIKTVAQVGTAEEARDALCNGFPVTIASDFGTHTIKPADGRQVAKWNDRWMHQMCLIGYDGSAASGERYFYVINSWGPNAHPKPLQGEPPGGFWIRWKDCDKIVDQGDSFAFSSFQGFPAQELDLRVFGAVPQVTRETNVTMEDPMCLTALGLCLTALGLCLVLFAVSFTRRAAMLMMALTFGAADIASAADGLVVFSSKPAVKAPADFQVFGSPSRQLDALEVFPQVHSDQVAQEAPELPSVIGYEPAFYCPACLRAKAALQHDPKPPFRVSWQRAPHWVEEWMLSGRIRGYPAFHWNTPSGPKVTGGWDNTATLTKQWQTSMK